jgi:hypothetical protein
VAWSLIVTKGAAMRPARRRPELLADVGAGIAAKAAISLDTGSYRR